MVKKDLTDNIGINTYSLADYNNLLLQKYFLFNKIPINIKDPIKLDIHLKLDKTISLLEYKISEFLIPNLSAVWIGSFPILDKSYMDSYYKDNIIYLNNKILTIEKFYYSFLYELTRVIAESYNLLLTSDGQLEREFITKRLLLYNKLTISQKKIVHIDHFLDIKYNKALYNFLYVKLNKTYLEKLCKEIFIHYNGAYALEEYFAITYYTYITKTKTLEELNNYGPIVFEKMKNLIEYSKG